MTRQMHLGVFVLGTGNHIAGWRYPGAFDSFQSLPVVQQIARTAERGRFDLLFLGDGLSADPKNHPVLHHPAGADHHAGGARGHHDACRPRRHRVHHLQPAVHRRPRLRLAGTTSAAAGPAGTPSRRSGAEAAGNFGRTHPPHDHRYEVAEEFVDVVNGLWDCWEDGGRRDRPRHPANTSTRRRVHALDHHGTYFDVRGPLNISRCPQGRPRDPASRARRSRARRSPRARPMWCSPSCRTWRRPSRATPR